MKLNIKILIAILLICGVVITIILLQTGIIENLPYDEETCAGWEQKCADEIKEFKNDGKVTGKLIYRIKENPENIGNPSLENCCSARYIRAPQVQRQINYNCQTWVDLGQVCDTGKILKSNPGSITNPSKDTCCENEINMNMSDFTPPKAWGDEQIKAVPKVNYNNCQTWLEDELMSKKNGQVCGVTKKLKSNLDTITNPSKDTCCEFDLNTTEFENCKQFKDTFGEAGCTNEKGTKFYYRDEPDDRKWRATDISSISLPVPKQEIGKFLKFETSRQRENNLLQLGGLTVAQQRCCFTGCQKERSDRDNSRKQLCVDDLTFKKNYVTHSKNSSFSEKSDRDPTMRAASIPQKTYTTPQITKLTNAILDIERIFDDKKNYKQSYRPER